MSQENQNPKITRMLVLGPSANISTSELVQRLHMMEIPIIIKSTCYGAIVHGDKKDVEDSIERARKLDPYNIFIKDRGFPPGDPRRCRGHRGAAREGFHQLEREFRLLDFVGEALKQPQKVRLKKPQKVSPDVFREIINEKTKKNHKKE
ncbi:MAG: methanogenesis marker 6 protein [Euryarchaeota archaeon]|nr:methanogenesis marker 6 protein [Euryarchaeota archaeon]